MRRYPTVSPSASAGSPMISMMSGSETKKCIESERDGGGVFDLNAMILDRPTSAIVFGAYQAIAGSADDDK